MMQRSAKREMSITTELHQLKRSKTFSNLAAMNLRDTGQNEIVEVHRSWKRSSCISKSKSDGSLLSPPRHQILQNHWMSSIVDCAIVDGLVCLSLDDSCDVISTARLGSVSASFEDSTRSSSVSFEELLMADGTYV